MDWRTGVSDTDWAVSLTIKHIMSDRRALSLMPRNWQQKDWPNFKWDRSRISAAEEQFLLGAGVAIGAVKHRPYRRSSSAF